MKFVEVTIVAHEWIPDENHRKVLINPALVYMLETIDQAATPEVTRVYVSGAEDMYFPVVGVRDELAQQIAVAFEESPIPLQGREADYVTAVGKSEE